MSHFTKVANASIKDVKAFVAAAKELGFEVVEGCRECRGYYEGRTEHVDVVVRKQGCKFDVGLVKNGDHYDMVSDWGYLGLDDAQGRFLQGTLKHTVQRQMAQKGFMAQTVENKDGSVTLKLQR